jgi:hypothetical protein
MARHERKGGGEVGDAGRGSNAYAGAVDVALALRRPEGATRLTLRVLHALSRFDETPLETAVEWSDGGYVGLGDVRDVALHEARQGILAEAPEAPEHALSMDELLERLPGVKRTSAQEAMKALRVDGFIDAVGSGRRGDPRRYYRSMVSAGTPGGSGGMNGRGDA